MFFIFLKITYMFESLRRAEITTWPSLLRQILLAVYTQKICCNPSYASCLLAYRSFPGQQHLSFSTVYLPMAN